MHLLIDELPKSITIDDIEYPINTSFRVMLMMEELFQDKDIPKNYKLLLAVKNLYGNETHDVLKAIEDMDWYYSMGETIKGDTGSSKQVFSFKHDAKYVYGAFKSQYGIDLYDERDLHWWKFKSLFDSLTEEHMIMQIINYRSKDLKTIKDRKTRDFYKRMQETYALPDDLVDTKKVLSAEDIANAFG